MSRVHLLAVCAAFIAASPTQAAPAPTLSPAVEKEAQCLLLYLAAAGAKDEKTQPAAVAGSWYFLGKLDVSAPGIDLVTLLRDQTIAMQSNPRAKEIGAACDAELAKRGHDLIGVGSQLEDKPAQSSSSS
jgi:hypothetical protein